MKFFVTSVFYICVLAVSSAVSAHSLGSSIETQKDGFLIDVGYEPEIVTVGTQTRFDFSLYNNETREDVPFDNIWFRIEQDNKVYFAGGLTKQNFGATGMTYRFTEPGQYELYVRYGTGTESIVDTTNTFDVIEAPDTRTAADKLKENAKSISLGTIIGLLAMYAVQKLVLKK